MKSESRVALLEAQNQIVKHDNVSLNLRIQREAERNGMTQAFLSLVKKIEQEEGVKINIDTLEEIVAGDPNPPSQA